MSFNKVDANRGSEDALQLELKERLNYTYIFQEGLLTINKALNSDNYDEEKVQKLILNLYAKIPDSWIDDEFKEDIKKCIQKFRIDVRPNSCGTKLSSEACRGMGLDIEKTIEVVDIYRIQTAIVNLLDRRNMLVRRSKIEYSTGKNLKDLVEENDIPKEDIENELEGDVNTGI